VTNSRVFQLQDSGFSFQAAIYEGRAPLFVDCLGKIWVQHPPTEKRARAVQKAYGYHGGRHRETKDS
jgi:hypothetical protein